MNALMLERYTLFIADTSVNEDPDAHELAHRRTRDRGRALLRRPASWLPVAFQLRVLERPSARKMRHARDPFLERCPDVEADGELYGDAALRRAAAPGVPARVPPRAARPTS
ncbi:MAG: phosphate acyltransferase [Burkholderiaceae bacterium]